MVTANRGLATTASLAPVALASLVIALLIAGVSSAGLLLPDSLYPSPAARLAFVPSERASWIADFIVAVPVVLVFGVQLWRRTALGYAAGPGLLLGYGLLALRNDASRHALFIPVSR